MAREEIKGKTGKIMIGDALPPRFLVVVSCKKKSAWQGFDPSRRAYLVDVSEPREDGKANRELVRFLSKAIGKQVRIVSGLASRKKVVEVISNP